MALDKPKLIFQAQVKRKPFFRRFAWWILGAVAATGAGIALHTAATRDIADSKLLTIGQVVAVVVVVLALVRAFANLITGLRRKNETLRFYDRGFVWIRGKNEFKYGWGQVVTFREGVRDVVVLGRPILQTGAHELKMRDEKVFRVTGVHGDMRRFARVVRPHIAEVMGARMGEALRNDRAVKLHKQLSVRPGGIKAGKHQIAWSELDVAIKNNKLIIRRLNDAGRFKTVKTFDTHEINNLGGFMEIAASTIRNYQPERFNIKVQGPRYGK